MLMPLCGLYAVSRGWCLCSLWGCFFEMTMPVKDQSYASAHLKHHRASRYSKCAILGLLFVSIILGEGISSSSAAEAYEKRSVLGEGISSSSSTDTYAEPHSAAITGTYHTTDYGIVLLGGEAEFCEWDNTNLQIDPNQPVVDDNGDPITPSRSYDYLFKPSYSVCLKSIPPEPPAAAGGDAGNIEAVTEDIPGHMLVTPLANATMATGKRLVIGVGGGLHSDQKSAYVAVQGAGGFSKEDLETFGDGPSSDPPESCNGACDGPPEAILNTDEPLLIGGDGKSSGRLIVYNNGIVNSEVIILRSITASVTAEIIIGALTHDGPVLRGIELQNVPPALFETKTIIGCNTAAVCDLENIPSAPGANQFWRPEGIRDLGGVRRVVFKHPSEEGYYFATKLVGALSVEIRSGYTVFGQTAVINELTNEARDPYKLGIPRNPRTQGEVLYTSNTYFGGTHLVATGPSDGASPPILQGSANNITRISK